MALIVGDFNGDGKKGLAIAFFGSSKLRILYGNGKGGFKNSIDFDVGTDPVALAAGDFNGDGKTDLVVANHDGNDVSVLLHA